MNLHVLWYILIAVLFTGYFLLEGYDYGIGILLPFLAREDRERRLFLNAMGPFLFGNETWLVAAGGAMFAAFPAWYGTFLSSLYLLIVALLISLMLRGAGVEFRAHHESKRWRAFWDGMIFVGSVLPGLIWGVIAAAALHPSIAALMLPLVGVRFFGVARGVFRYLERLLSHQVTFRLLATLRSSVYEQLEPLLPAYLHIPAHESGEMRRSGDVVQRLVSDIETLQQFYVRVVAPPAVAVLIGGLLWWFLGAFGGTFAFLFLICFLLAGAGIPALSYLLSHRLAQRAVKLRATLQGTLIDGVQGRADLLAFGQEEWYLACVHRQQEELNQVQILMARIGSLQQALRTVSRV